MNENDPDRASVTHSDGRWFIEFGPGADGWLASVDDEETARVLADYVDRLVANGGDPTDPEQATWLAHMSQRHAR